MSTPESPPSGGATADTAAGGSDAAAGGSDAAAGGSDAAAGGAAATGGEGAPQSGGGGDVVNVVPPPSGSGNVTPPPSGGAAPGAITPPSVSGRRRTTAQSGESCLIVLLDYKQRPVMNLHNVPLNADVGRIKTKISERLTDIGRHIGPENLLLYLGEEQAEELSNKDILLKYNPMKLSKLHLTIIRVDNLTINCRAVHQNKCLCITRAPQVEQQSFQVIVGSNKTIRDLKEEILRRMKVDTKLSDFIIYYAKQIMDESFDDMEIKQVGIKDKSIVLVDAPSTFSGAQVPPLAEGDLTAPAGAGSKPTPAGPAAEDTAAAVSGVAAAAAAAAPKEKVKSETEKKFDTVAKGKPISQAQAGDLARSMGYSPSQKEIAGLSSGTSFAQFQEFLGVCVHAEDDEEEFAAFFRSFDSSSKGEITAKQLENISQFWGDEPLTAAEAKSMMGILMKGKDKIDIDALTAAIMSDRS